METSMWQIVLVFELFHENTFLGIGIITIISQNNYAVVHNKTVQLRIYAARRKVTVTVQPHGYYNFIAISEIGHHKKSDQLFDEL